MEQSHDPRTEALSTPSGPAAPAEAPLVEEREHIVQSTPRPAGVAHRSRIELLIELLGDESPAVLGPVRANLVAAGQTNREVATALFLGERTVASHLTHIYAKLAVRSRTELARKLQ